VLRPSDGLQRRHSLKAILGWHKGANGGCGHKIFGDILFASAICAVPGHMDFPAHNAEQAFVIWIKNTRSRVSGRRHIGDESGKLASHRK
jgi:hypothetical protein